MKFMNLKRFGATVMAGVLALSMAVPAFAADTTPAGQVTITGSYQDIEIAVSVPTTGTAQINPYGLPVDFTLSDTITKLSISGEQITTAPLSIRNQGTTKLSVNATLAVATEGGVIVKENNLTGSEDGKEINLALQVAGLDNVKYAVSSLDTTLEDNIIRAFADPATWASVKSLKAKDTAASTAIADAPVAKSEGGVGTLAALGAATEGAGGLITYGKDSIAVFRLTGKVNESPQKDKSGGGTEDDPWVAADKFSAKVVFKFKPYKDATLTIDTSTLALHGTGGTTNKGTVTVDFKGGDTGLTATGYQWVVEPSTAAAGYTLSAATAATTDVTASSTAAASATLKCTATLSDGSTKEVTCALTYAS